MKYELTSDTIVVNGVTLYRIRALKNFADVEAGNVGGYVQSEANLSQEGKCWVFDDAKVYGDALVYDNAWVAYSARVYGNARVLGNAWVASNAQVYGIARVFGNAYVHTHAMVYGNARVFGNAYVHTHAMVYGNARVFGNACVKNHSQVSDSAVVASTSMVDNSIIRGMAVITAATVTDSEVGGFAEIVGWYIKDRRVMNTSDLELV